LKERSLQCHHSLGRAMNNTAVILYGSITGKSMILYDIYNRATSLSLISWQESQIWYKGTCAYVSLEFCSTLGLKGLNKHSLAIPSEKQLHY
jgi:hypothetical protein